MWFVLKRTYSDTSKNSILCNHHKRGARVDFYKTEKKAMQAVYEDMVENDVFSIILDDDTDVNDIKFRESMTEKDIAEYKADFVETRKQAEKFASENNPSTKTIKEMLDWVHETINPEIYDIRVGKVS